MDFLVADALNGFDVFGGAALHYVEYAHQFPKPLWKSIRELEFEDDLFFKAPDRIGHFSLHSKLQVGLGQDDSVHGDADFIVVADVSFPHIKDVDPGPGMHLVHEIAKSLNGDDLIGTF